jgi:hypothetical protein
MSEAYYAVIDAGKKGKEAVQLSMENHHAVIHAASKDLDHALQLVQLLQEHIEHRMKHYTKCISKSTPNYLKYLIETYNRQLIQQLRHSIED